jgi:gluconokinase
MGVAGCGKTTMGRALAEEKDYPFFDADDFHPPENVEKMSRGEPLNDSDRQGWLTTLARLIHEHDDLVLACSALKRSYRSTLQGSHEVTFIYLAIGPDVARARLKARADHYMPASLIDSQFATLEEPSDDDAVHIDAEDSPDAVRRAVLAACASPPARRHVR